MIQIPVSEMQEAIIAENALYDKPLTMYANERPYIVMMLQRKHPGAKIKSAHLNIAEGVWEVEILN